MAATLPFDLANQCLKPLSHSSLNCVYTIVCTGEKGIEPLSVVLETTVLPIKLFSRCVVYNLQCMYTPDKDISLSAHCVYNTYVQILHVLCVQLAKLYYLLCRIAVLPYCRIMHNAHMYCTQGAGLHICMCCKFTVNTQTIEAHLKQRLPKQAKMVRRFSILIA